MLKLYKQSQIAQINWIRNHPVQWIALNSVLIAGFYGFVKYQERKERLLWQKLNIEREAVK